MSRTPVETNTAASGATTNHLPTLLQHSGKTHRVGSGLVGATETSVTFATKHHDDPPVYARLGNTSNHFEVQKILADLHSTEASAVFGSGMAAFTATAFAFLRPGDHVLVQENCYGGTHQLFTRLIAQMGVAVEFAPIHLWNSIARPNTRMAVFESISNPFCSLADIAATAKWARDSGVTTLCDNTFASPYNCRPCGLGVDLVLESATKYLNGHSDVTAGMIAGNAAFVKKVGEYSKFMGGFLPASQCAQLVRGLRTFDLRMERHNRNGQLFADAMRNRHFVERVHYGPSKEGQTNTQINEDLSRQFPGGFGGMCTLRFRSGVNTRALLKNLKYISDVPSLGGTESTVTSPCLTTNSWQSPEERTALGLDEQVLRFSIGIEDVRDIIADVDRAILEKTAKS